MASQVLLLKWELREGWEHSWLLQDLKLFFCIIQGPFAPNQTRFVVSIEQEVVIGLYPREAPMVSESLASRFGLQAVWLTL